MSDPIFQENGKWYFYDESWAHRYGPYDSEQECQKAFDDYVAQEVR